MPFEAIILVLLPVLLALSAVCSASETALFGLTHADRVRLRGERPRSSEAVARLLREPRKLLLTVLLLNMTVNVTYFVLSSAWALRAPTPVAGVAISLGTLAGIVLIGEILAKLLANADRVRVASLVAPPIAVVQRAVAPVLTGLERGVVSPMARVLAPRSGRNRAHNAAELTALLAEAGRVGAIDGHEQRLLAEVVELGRLRVRDVMTPRLDVQWLDEVDLNPARVREVLSRIRHGTIPVARDELQGERVLGMLDARRYLAAMSATPAPPPSGARTIAMRPARFVPENIRLDQLLEHFRATGTHTAMCVDEFGGVQGLVQVEDVVRSLVEAVGDEGEGDREPAHLVALGVWSVPGRLPVHELIDDFGLDARATDRRVSTVAGLVQLRLGRLPMVGDTVRVGRVTLEVERVTGRTVERLLVREADDEAPGADGRDASPDLGAEGGAP